MCWVYRYNKEKDLFEVGYYITINGNTVFIVISNEKSEMKARLNVHYLNGGD